MNEPDPGETNKRFRSPPYPSIPLSKAIERAKELYGKALHHSASIKVLADAWDYGTKSSGLWATAAALLQFGLLTDEGSGDKRKFQLTDSAVRIVRDPNPDSESRRMLIKQAALSPKIFNELWGDYGASVLTLSDVVLKSHLTIDRLNKGLASYSDNAADDVVRVFKDTIGFAGLSDSDSLPDNERDKDPEIGPDATFVRLDKSGDEGAPSGGLPPRPTAPLGKVNVMSGERELTTGLLSKDASFRLIVSGQIGVKEIDRLIAKLQIDKEILAEQDVEGEQKLPPPPY